MSGKTQAQKDEELKKKNGKNAQVINNAQQHKIPIQNAPEAGNQAEAIKGGTETTNAPAKNDVEQQLTDGINKGYEARHNNAEYQQEIKDKTPEEINAIDTKYWQRGKADLDSLGGAKDNALGIALSQHTDTLKQFNGGAGATNEQIEKITNIQNTLQGMGLTDIPLENVIGLFNGTTGSLRFKDKNGKEHIIDQGNADEVIKAIRAEDTDANQFPYRQRGKVVDPSAPTQEPEAPADEEKQALKMPEAPRAAMIGWHQDSDGMRAIGAYGHTPIAQNAATAAGINIANLEIAKNREATQAQIQLKGAFHAKSLEMRQVLEDTKYATPEKKAYAKQEFINSILKDETLSPNGGATYEEKMQRYQAAQEMIQNYERQAQTQDMEIKREEAAITFSDEMTRISQDAATGQYEQNPAQIISDIYAAVSNNPNLSPLDRNKAVTNGILNTAQGFIGNLVQKDIEEANGGFIYNTFNEAQNYADFSETLKSAAEAGGLLSETGLDNLDITIAAIVANGQQQLQAYNDSLVKNYQADYKAASGAGNVVLANQIAATYSEKITYLANNGDLSPKIAAESRSYFKPSAGKGEPTYQMEKLAKDAINDPDKNIGAYINGGGGVSQLIDNIFNAIYPPGSDKSGINEAVERDKINKALLHEFIAAKEVKGAESIKGLFPNTELINAWKKDIEKRYGDTIDEAERSAVNSELAALKAQYTDSLWDVIVSEKESGNVLKAAQKHSETFYSQAYLFFRDTGNTEQDMKAGKQKKSAEKINELVTSGVDVKGALDGVTHTTAGLHHVINAAENDILSARKESGWTKENTEFWTEQDKDGFYIVAQHGDYPPQRYKIEKDKLTSNGGWEVVNY